VVKRDLDYQGVQRALRGGGEMRAIDVRVAMCACYCRSIMYTLMGGRRGIGEGVAHVVNHVLDVQGAQHALRDGEMRASDARVALCVC